MKLACIDVGLKRIGVAISLDGKIVMPQDAILRKNRNQASEEMERRIKHFVSLLELSIPVAYQDEQSSSIEAKELTMGIFKHKKDGKIDSIAAKIILERFLNA